MKNQNTILSTSLLLLIQCLCIHSANILFYHQIASYSHQVATYPLAEALVQRGHDITYITPWHHKGSRPLNPNITMIIPKNYEKTVNAFATADFEIKYRVEKKFPRLVHQFYPTAITTCQDLLTSSELKEWTTRTAKLDLMIIDNCFSECALAIAYKYGAKHVFINVVSHLGNEYDQYGFNPESSAIPELEIDPPQVPMSFMERVINTLIPLHFRWAQYSYQGEIDRLVRGYLNDPAMPFIDDLVRNASLVLYTGDLITEHPRSHPPFVVNIGGMHCASTNNKGSDLPEDIAKFIDESPSEYDGFIYISFGSVAISSKLPDSVKQVFFDSVRAFPKLKFLWKWNGPIPKNLPKNLHLAPWYPQVQVLAHPKIRGFITQGGRPSTMEALCNAVPMIAFPVLGDQDLNANRMNKMGVSIKLELATVSREELETSIQKLAYDSSMKERMLHLRNILNDQPMPPLDKAVWWVEYVLRHKDTTHLRPAGFDQWWFQRRLLDVWAFVFTLIATVLSIITLIILWALRKFVFKNKGQTKKSPKKMD